VPSAPPSASPARCGDGERRTVLLIEDSPGDAALVREMLDQTERYSEPEHEIRAADAVRWLSAHRADCTSST